MSNSTRGKSEDPDWEEGRFRLEARGWFVLVEGTGIIHCIAMEESTASDQEG